MMSSRRRDAPNRTKARVAGVLAAASGMVCLHALATDYHWVVPVGTWNNGPNWNPTGEPGPNDNAFVDYASNATISVTANVGSPQFVYIDNGDTVTVFGDSLHQGFLGANTLLVETGSLNIVRGNPILGGGGDVTATSDLKIGSNGQNQHGTVTQSGGVLSIPGLGSFGGEMELGNNGFGTFNLSGGALNMPNGDLVVGVKAQSGHGTLHITGGSATVAGLSPIGIDVLTQSAGQMNIGTHGIDMGFAAAGATYQLTGGTLSCTGAASLNGSASISYSGGTLWLGTLAISGSAQVHLASGGGKVLRATSVNIGTVSGGAFAGGIDLTDNAMIVDYTGASPLTSIRSMIQGGTYDGFTGQASGIISSTAIIGASSHPTALGYGEASALHISTFAGQSVDSTAVLVRYTYAGDANLDGIVNALDFNALASNYGSAGKLWPQGDFNSDGIVNTLDFTLLAGNFAQPALSSPALTAPVPEPTVFAFPMLLGLWRRGRRKAETR